jgi:hypothetical protein
MISRESLLSERFNVEPCEKWGVSDTTRMWSVSDSGCGCCSNSRYFDTNNPDERALLLEVIEAQIKLLMELREKL